MAPGGKSLKLTAEVEPSPEAVVELPAVAPVVWQLGGGIPLAADQTYILRASVSTASRTMTGLLHSQPTNHSSRCRAGCFALRTDGCLTTQTWRPAERSQELATARGSALICRPSASVHSP